MVFFGHMAQREQYGYEWSRVLVFGCWSPFAGPFASALLYRARGEPESVCVNTCARERKGERNRVLVLRFYVLLGRGLWEIMWQQREQCGMHLLHDGRVARAQLEHIVRVQICSVCNVCGTVSALPAREAGACREREKSGTCQHAKGRLTARLAGRLRARVQDGASTRDGEGWVSRPRRVHVHSDGTYWYSSL